MKKIKILVTGAGGQLANCIQDELKNSKKYKNISATFVSHKEFDISKSTEEVEDFFANSDEHYDYVINCAAYTNVNGAEDPKNKATAFACNTLGPYFLAYACEKYHMTLIHISTDYVFPGVTMKVAYETSENMAPLNYYGLTKANGEQNIINTADITNLQYMIIRTSWLYSEYRTNFVKSILKQYLSGRDLNVIYDQVGSPTNAHDLAHFIIDSVVYQDRLSYYHPEIKSGIYHFCNDGVISWFDFAKEIVEQYKELAKKEGIMVFSDPSVNPIPESDMLKMMEQSGSIIATRPKASLLDKTNSKAIGYNFRYWKDSLRDVINLIVNKLDK